MRGLDPRIHGAAWAVFAGWAVAPATALSLPQSRAVPRRATVLPSGPQRRATVSTWLPREIEAKRGALQQVLRPIAEAGGLPNETYTSRSEEHTSELQSLMRNSYDVFCLKK